MRWTKAISGETRHRLKFLWFPLRVGYEVRWLEYARVCYVYRDNSEGKGWKAYGFAVVEAEAKAVRLALTVVAWVVAWVVAVIFSVLALAAKLAGY